MIQTNIKTKFGRLLEETRNAQNLKQKEVAAKIGEKLKTYQAWEEGRTQPHLHQIDKLFRIYGETFIEKLFQ